MHAARRACMFAAGLALALVGPTAVSAPAESRLVAHYRISAAGIAIGTSAIEAVIGDSAYTMGASGRTSGVLRILVSGEGTVTTRGMVVDGALVPARFTSRTTDEDERAAVTMTLEGGNVKDLTAKTSAPGEARVPLTAEHRRGVVDPLTALFLTTAEHDSVDAEACRRTLPVFDGRRRYDLALAFKRLETVRAAGYAGPAVVCAVAFRAIAGHRADSRLVNYLADGRDIELTLAPVSGTRLLAPFRLSITSMLGDMVIVAITFETHGESDANRGGSALRP
jgi:hypothetical protein